MDCDESCMIGRMKESKNSTRNLRRVKIFVPEDSRLKAGVKLKSSHSNAAHPKNHLAWYVALNSKPVEEKISQIPQIKWKCPPKFALNTVWHVAAGERSLEAEVQNCRETTVLEVIYPHLSAIPPSPFSSLESGSEHCDNSQTLIIPVIPIEEEATAAETPVDISVPVNTGNNPQTPASPKGPSVSGILSLPQSSPSVSQDQPVNDKSLPDILRGLKGVDLEVAAAAAAIVAAIMDSKEQIDTQLLMKFLADPEMVKKLIDERPYPELGTPPAPQPKRLSPLPGSNSDVPPPINLTIESGGPVHSHIHHVAGVKQVRPLMPSTLRPDEETVKRLIDQHGAPDIAGVVPVSSLNPSTSKPNMEAIKKLINEYGAPDAAGIKPMAPLVSSTSRPNVEEMKEMISKYGLPDQGWGRPFLGPNLHALPNGLESNLTGTGAFNFPHPSSATIPASQVDMNHHKSPIAIRQHGEKPENGPTFGQPGNYLQGLKLGHNKTLINMNPKYQKPCFYFSSSKGCRNGSNCPYQHDVYKQWRAGGVVEAPIAKRMKFSEWTGKL